MKILMMLFMFSCPIFSENFKTYIMDSKYFICKYPAEWKIERDVSKDVKSRIYKVVFVNQKDAKTAVTIRYYSPKSGKNHKTFIETQSVTSDGKKESSIEKYEEVKNIEIFNRKAFEINRKFKEFESIEYKSSSYWLKERIIVIPAKKGFYAVTFSSKEEDFGKYGDVFDKILKSIKFLY